MIRHAIDALRNLKQILTKLDKVQQSLGRIEARQCSVLGQAPVQSLEFQVFSQWGEDGLIHFLTEKVRSPSRKFVEFGVEDYQESNTRFLLTHKDWAGLVLDSSEENIAKIRSAEFYWKHNLKAFRSMITAENINSVLRENGMEGEIGLLSVDIDGNDYWVWKAIDAVRPDIVVCEYNSLFGATRAVTVPYTPDFSRGAKHSSNLYFGASLSALCTLAQTKGYSLIFSNSSGCNAFFVRNERLGDLKPQSAAQAYVKSSFREARDADTKLLFLSHEEGKKLIGHLPLVELESGKTITVADL